MTKKPIRIAVCPGAERGVGPELLAKALNEKALEQDIAILWCGDQMSLGLGCDRGRVPLVIEGYTAVIGSNQPVKFFDDIAGNALVRQARFLEIAIAAAHAGEIDAIVTGPIEKAALDYVSGGPFAGQTELFAHHFTADKKPFMAFLGGPFMMTMLTTHVPVKRIADVITGDGLLEHIVQAATHWARMHGKLSSDTRLTVLGLNPHAGEDGLIGSEEKQIYDFAIKCAQNMGLKVEGPVPADGFFAYLHRQHRLPDVVIASYHDQGLCPYKLLAQGRAVNVTFGLSLPRTSPAHGIAADIAGKGIACALSTKAALEAAIFLARNH